MSLKNNLLIKYNNNKVLFWNITGSFGVKGLAMLINILTLPAYLNYFTNQSILGIWFTIISVLNWALTFDLGIGNGLRNLIVEPYVNKDFKRVKEYISTAYISIGLISLCLGLFFFVVFRYLNFNRFLNISPEVIEPKLLFNSFFIITVTVLLQLFLRLIISILYALQKTAISNLIPLISNTLIFLFLISFKFSSTGDSLINLSILYFLAINIPLLIAAVLVFSTILKESRPQFKFFKFSLTKKILNLGLIFLLIQLSLLIINSTNEIIITNFFNPEEVVAYQAYFRIFNIYLVLFSLLTIPLWSAVTKAFSENNISWIKKVYFYLNLVGVFFVLLIFFTSFFIKDIIELWIGSNKIEIDYLTALIVGVYNSIMIFIYSSNCIANGISKLKPQLVLNISAAIIKFPLFLILYEYYKDWYILIIVNIIIMFPAMILQPYYNYKNLKIIKN